MQNGRFADFFIKEFVIIRDFFASRKVITRHTDLVVLLTRIELLTIPSLLALKTLKIFRKIDLAKSTFYSTDFGSDFIIELGKPVVSVAIYIFSISR